MVKDLTFFFSISLGNQLVFTDKFYEIGMGGKVLRFQLTVLVLAVWFGLKVLVNIGS